jgi:hypothetical protein
MNKNNIHTLHVTMSSEMGKKVTTKYFIFNVGKGFLHISFSLKRPLFRTKKCIY